MEQQHDHAGHTHPHTGEHTHNHGGNNTGLAVLAYLGILVIIPLITSRHDDFVKFHAKQGLVLLILWVITTFIGNIPVLGGIAAPILALCCVILVIVGIVNAVNGHKTELPVVGKYGAKFNF